MASTTFSPVIDVDGSGRSSLPLKCLREVLYLFITYNLTRYLGYPSISKSTIATTTLIYLISLLLRRHITQRSSEAYGLEHALLNNASNSPAGELWCNMGYWSSATTFTTANLDLLSLLANTADLSAPGAPGRRDTVLDLGTGCGTQSIHLLKSYAFESYTSITSHPAQNRVAKRQLAKRYANGTTGCGTRIRVVLGDAANPPPEILSKSYTKILALDCAYHFPGPRRRFFERMHGLLDQDHGGTFALTDIILGDTTSISLLNKLKMRALCVLVLGVPWVNMIPLHEYKAALVGAGFAVEDIEILDITDDVFAPFAAWITSTSAAAVDSQRGWRMYKIFARVLRWWAENGVVRFIVVRARKAGAPRLDSAITEKARGGLV